MTRPAFKRRSQPANLTYPDGDPTPKVVLPSSFNFGDPVFTANMRLTRTFPCKERYKPDIFGEMFTMFNVANLTGYGTVLDTYNAAACGPLAAGAYATSCAARTYRFGYADPRSIQTSGQTGPRAAQIGAHLITAFSRASGLRPPGPPPGKLLSWSATLACKPASGVDF